MSLTIENRLMLLLKKAFVGLDVAIADEECLQLARFVHQTMDHKYRIYHTSSHVFDLCEGMNARQILSALFHDTVYYQLDALAQVAFLESVINRIGIISHGILVLNEINPDDLVAKLCATVFGFKSGSQIPLYNGANEFLSAILFTDFLLPYLNLKDLVAVIAAIEATIPFRGPDAQGRVTSVLLAQRIFETSKLVGFDISEHEVDIMVQDAIVFANKDVASFSANDPSHFVSTTWLLIEEANNAFKTPNEYTVQDYRKALISMENFFLTLNPEFVFHQYKTVPNQQEFAKLNQVAQHNIDFALNYIGTKLASIGLVEALALLTGGDCPIMYILGDLNENRNNGQLSTLINMMPINAPTDPALLKILVSGRSRPSKYDLTESPITAYMCKLLGQECVLKISAQAKQMFAGHLSPKSFIDSLDIEMVKTIISSCVDLPVARTTELLALDLSQK